MPASVNARAGADSANELDITGEFPQPAFGGDRYGGEETETAEVAEESEAEPQPDDPRSAQERTSFWLQHLESEVQRLQGKFESLAAELRVREARINALRGQVEAKDALVNELRRQLDEQDAAHSALRTELEQAHARIADLLAAEVAGEINLAQAEADLQDARQAAAGSEANRDELLEKIARLSEAVDRDAAAAADAQRLYEDEARRANGLRARVEELESYIEGSKQRWVAVSDELADYRNKLGVSERRLAEVQAASMAETQARERIVTEAQRLQSLLSQSARQIDEMASVIDAHESTISRLEAELHAKHDAAAVLERSVRKLAEIDSGIAGLDRLASTADENAPSANEGRAPASDGALNPRRTVVEAAVGDKPPFPARKVESTVAQPDDSSDVRIQPRVTRPR